MRICKKVIISLLACLMSLSLSGCGEEKEVSKWDMTLRGIDDDKDGIRDDIAEKMKKEFANQVTEDEEKVMIQHAQIFQRILDMDLTDPKNKSAILLTRQHLDDAMNCAIYIFGDDLRYHNYSIMLTQLKQWYFNTQMRKDHRKEFSIRSIEYHYKAIPLEGDYTCDFEISEQTKKLISIREELKKQQESNKNK
jgi:hypothetical protein